MTAPGKVDVKAEVRALLDRLPDDCTFADVQRGIAVLMWPKKDDGSLAPPETAQMGLTPLPAGASTPRRLLPRCRR